MRKQTGGSERKAATQIFVAAIGVADRDGKSFLKLSCGHVMEVSEGEYEPLAPQRCFNCEQRRAAK